MVLPCTDINIIAVVTDMKCLQCIFKTECECCKQLVKITSPHES